jgi:hypothetical protein
LTLGYNTSAQLAASTPTGTRADRGRGTASDADEAKWNFAFWLHNELLRFGVGGATGSRTVRRWIQDMGLAISDREFDLAYSHGVDEEVYSAVRLKEVSITSHFVEACCALASSLHRGGVIEKLRGKPIPILVHELEYYDEIAKQNIDCNPAGLVDEFAAWVRSI